MLDLVAKKQDVIFDVKNKAIIVTLASKEKMDKIANLIIFVSFQL